MKNRSDTKKRNNLIISKEGENDKTPHYAVAALSVLFILAGNTWYIQAMKFGYPTLPCLNQFFNRLTITSDLQEGYGEIWQNLIQLSDLQDDGEIYNKNNTPKLQKKTCYTIPKGKNHGAWRYWLLTQVKKIWTRGVSYSLWIMPTNFSSGSIICS